jgi:hypothetical protein
VTAQRWIELAVGILGWFLVLALLYACTTKVPADLDRFQRDAQDCILRGGHARLGPAETIVCIE